MPSVTRERSFFGEHEEFLRIALAKPVFVKIVVSKSVSIPEFLTAVHLVARVDRTVPLVLQPRTALADETLEPGIGNFLSNLISVARRELQSVRVIPQMHKWLAIK